MSLGQAVGMLGGQRREEGSELEIKTREFRKGELRPGDCPSVAGDAFMKRKGELTTDPSRSSYT